MPKGWSSGSGVGAGPPGTRGGGVRVASAFLLRSATLRGTPVAPRHCVSVDSGEHIVGIVQRHQRDSIAMFVEKFLQPIPLSRLRPGLQEWMTEKARLGQTPKRVIAGEDIGQILCKRCRVEGRMRVGVVAEFSPGIEP